MVKLLQFFLFYYIRRELDLSGSHALPYLGNLKIVLNLAKGNGQSNTFMSCRKLFEFSPFDYQQQAKPISFAVQLFMPGLPVGLPRIELGVDVGVKCKCHKDKDARH